MNHQPREAKEILRARARALAQPLERRTETGAILELLQFNLAQEHYAIETRFVVGVHPLKDLTALPCTPRFVRGIVNVRGRILPVFDLKRFFDLPDDGLTDLHRVILVRGYELELGLLADITVGVRTLPAASLQPSLPTLTGVRQDYLKGVTADRLVVLDLDHILTDPKIVVHEEVDA
jgi:purine-binding chemotaxis protein CheW